MAADFGFCDSGCGQRSPLARENGCFFTFVNAEESFKTIGSKEKTILRQKSEADKPFIDQILRPRETQHFHQLL